MYIFGYKTTVFMQNLYILVKFFGKNFIFSVESTFFSIFCPKCTFLVQNYTFYAKFVHFGESFGKNFIFSIKSTIFSIFQDQMYIFGYKSTVFIQNLYILVKLFGFSGPNVHFWVENYSFYPKFVHFGEFFLQMLNF